ncbi:MAG: hypothetical protein AB7S71_09395 [Dongiaceae bacterium]
MALPDPEPGLVIGYAYLWARRHAEGHEEAEKSRPCAIVLAKQDAAGDAVVTVVPITHSPPAAEDGIEIPPRTRQRLGLDDQPSWVVISEVNRFIWPGPDLRPIPGSASQFAYGMLPPKLFDAIKEALLRRAKASSLAATKRTE